MLNNYVSSYRYMSFQAWFFFFLLKGVAYRNKGFPLMRGSFISIINTLCSAIAYIARFTPEVSELRRCLHSYLKRLYKKIDTLFILEEVNLIGKFLFEAIFINSRSEMYFSLWAFAYCLLQASSDWRWLAILSDCRYSIYGESTPVWRNLQ